MSKKQRLIMIVALVAFIAVALISALIYVVTDAVRVADELRKRELAEPLEIEYRSLERELENYERRLAEPLPGGATMTIAALDLDEAVYTNLFKIMCEAGEEKYLSEHGRQMFVGTLCLSPEEMPGGTGKITLEQFREMLAAGWSVAIRVSESRAEALDSYLSNMKSRLATLNLGMTDTVYFDGASYREEHDELLLSYGIRNAIHTNSEGFDLVGTDISTEVWRVGAVGWSGTSANSALNAFNSLLISNGGLAFAVEMWYGSRESSTHFVPGDSDASFKNMLGVFGSSVLDGELCLDGVGSGKGRYAEYLDEYRLVKEQYEPQRAATVARMKEIKAELELIYES